MRLVTIPLVLVALAVAWTAGGAAAQGQARVDFASDVWPVLEKRCVSCHGRKPDRRGRIRKPKAGLRLDGRTWIEKGGESGRVLVPGKPALSSLYVLVALDEDDPDIMPARGKPLTKEQVAAIKRWIEEGADFGRWTGSSGPAAAKKPAPAAKPPVAGGAPSMVRLLARLGDGVRPLPDAAIEKARGSDAQITPAIPQSPLLRVDFVSHEQGVDDRRIQALAPLAGHVTHLNLARTRVGDGALATIGRMRRLTRLDLRDTAVTDRGIEKLKTLTELRYLNLYGTDVSDRGLDAVAALPNLRAVYLWQTEVTPAGAKELARKLPEAKINLGPDLPAPRPREEGQGRRRRRRPN